MDMYEDVPEPEVPEIAPQTTPIADTPSVIMPTTKEEALEGGIPEHQFDPEVHLYREVVQRSTRPVTVEIIPPEESENAE